LSSLLDLSLAWYVALFLLGTVLLALTSGSIQTIGADVAPADARGTFLGLWRFTSQSGATLSPVMFALLAELANYASSFVFVGACAAAVAFLLIRYVPETRTEA
jgi:sugar phosphate permease